MKSKSAIELLETWPVMEIGSVAALAIRPARSLPPQRADRVVALGGAGLAGDVHADPLSPRQLLLAGSPAYQSLDLPAHALRENLLLNLDTARLRSGHVLQVGCNVRLRLMFQCEACGRLDLQHPSLARALGARRGMLARVVTGGEMLPGDLVRDLGPQMPPWSDDWRERVLSLLKVVPTEYVVEYAQLARLAGIASSYCRAFPALLRKLEPRYALRAVARDAAPERPRWDGRGLFDTDACGP
jgi:hypothetical protein